MTSFRDTNHLSTRGLVVVSELLAFVSVLGVGIAAKTPRRFCTKHLSGLRQSIGGSQAAEHAAGRRSGSPCGPETFPCPRSGPFKSPSWRIMRRWPYGPCALTHVLDAPRGHPASSFLGARRGAEASICESPGRMLGTRAERVANQVLLAAGHWPIAAGACSRHMRRDAMAVSGRAGPKAPVRSTG